MKTAIITTEHDFAITNLANELLIEHVYENKGKMVSLTVSFNADSCKYVISLVYTSIQ